MQRSFKPLNTERYRGGGPLFGAAYVKVTVFRALIREMWQVQVLSLSEIFIMGL